MAYFHSPAAKALRDQLNAAYPKRDKASDGWIGDTAHNARKSDHNPDWDAGGIVRAIDVDKDLFGLGREAESQVETQRIVDALTTDPRTAYVIYRERIWQNPAVFPNAGGWKPYTAAGKTGWFNPHEQHFHLSVRRGATWDHDAKPWPIIPTTSEEDELMAAADDILKRIESLEVRLTGVVAGQALTNTAGTQLATLRSLRDTLDVVHGQLEAQYAQGERIYAADERRQAWNQRHQASLADNLARRLDSAGLDPAVIRDAVAGALSDTVMSADVTLNLKG